jgi:hypothetical protein
MSIETQKAQEVQLRAMCDLCVLWRNVWVYAFSVREFL